MVALNVNGLKVLCIETTYSFGLPVEILRLLSSKALRTQRFLKPYHMLVHIGKLSLSTLR